MEHAMTFYIVVLITIYGYVWRLQVQPEWWLFASNDQSTVFLTVIFDEHYSGSTEQQWLFGVLSNLHFHCLGTSGSSGDG